MNIGESTLKTTSMVFHLAPLYTLAMSSTSFLSDLFVSSHPGTVLASHGPTMPGEDKGDYE